MKTLHTDKDSRLFYRADGWPEFPMCGPEDACYFIDVYNEALSKAFENAVPVSIPETVFRLKKLPVLTPLTAYDLPKGYQVEVKPNYSSDSRTMKSPFVAYLVPAVEPEKRVEEVEEETQEEEIKTVITDELPERLNPKEAMTRQESARHYANSEGNELYGDSTIYDARRDGFIAGCEYTDEELSRVNAAHNELLTKYLNLVKENDLLHRKLMGK
jgi:hypothetical protein